MLLPPSKPSSWAREPLAAKVPQITLLFWVIKLVTTFMGEATSDYFGDGNVVIGGAIEVVILGLAIFLQFRVRRYVPAAYWFLAMAIAIFGTGASDTLHIALGIPYVGTTAFWAIVLTAIFWRWYRSEGTLSIHSITTRRRETYYWATVFATFALGTALGDLTATSMSLGYLTSGIAFAAIFLVPAIAWWRFKVNAVVAFWFAYVVTRPFGASFADYVSKPHALSGVDFGDGATSLVAAVVLAALVAYLTITRTHTQPVTDKPMPDRPTAAIGELAVAEPSGHRSERAPGPPS
jgi:uncharacterized membrane-anchored protein